MNCETLPRSCPDCGAGIVISIKSAYCEANKYSSSLGAGDCRWELTLTPELRRQADEALAAENLVRVVLETPDVSGFESAPGTTTDSAIAFLRAKGAA